MNLFLQNSQASIKPSSLLMFNKDEIFGLINGYRMRFQVFTGKTCSSETFVNTY
jgi:hypothetical protein